jgi:hypothetical protein
MKLLTFTFRFVFEAIKALLNPENVQEWRTAYAYFVFPVFFIGGTAFGVAVILFWLLPSPWDWFVNCVWLFYILFCEPYMYYVEGDGFKRWNEWIEYGGE